MTELAALITALAALAAALGIRWPMKVMRGRQNDADTEMAALRAQLADANTANTLARKEIARARAEIIDLSEQHEADKADCHAEITLIRAELEARTDAPPEET